MAKKTPVAAPPVPFETIGLTGEMELISLTSEFASVRISAPHSPRAYTLNLPVVVLRAWLNHLDASYAGGNGGGGQEADKRVAP